MKKRSLYGLICLIMTFISCSKRNHIYLYSPDKKQCITIITINNERYIINGKHHSVPKDNYIKIDISEVDKIGDGIAGCWEDNNYQWTLINDKSIIVENKIDTLKYNFLTNFPVDERGVPTLKDFISGNCYNFDFEVFSILPKDGAIIDFE